MDLSKLKLSQSGELYTRTGYNVGSATLRLEIAKYNHHRLAIDFTEKANTFMESQTEREIFKLDGTSEVCKFLQFVHRAEHEGESFAHKYVGILEDSEGDLFPIELGSIEALEEFLELWENGGPDLTFDAIGELVNGKRNPFSQLFDTLFE